MFKGVILLVRVAYDRTDFYVSDLIKGEAIYQRLIFGLCFRDINVRFNEYPSII